MLDDAAARPDPPSPVQLEDHQILLLALIGDGVTAEAAARELDISTRTLRRRLQAICARLEVATSTEAVVWAAKQGLI